MRLEDYQSSLNAQIQRRLNEAADLLFERMKEHATLTDHSLEDLKKMGHPYSATHPKSIHSPDFSVHMQSGDLQGAMKVTTEGGTIRVGIDEAECPHAEAVIFGTPNMVARDFISGTYHELEGEIRGILKK